MAMKEYVRGLSDQRLEALYRVAKTKAYAFFRHPKEMMVIRAEVQRRKGRVAS